MTEEGQEQMDIGTAKKEAKILQEFGPQLKEYYIACLIKSGVREAEINAYRRRPQEVFSLAHMDSMRKTDPEGYELHLQLGDTLNELDGSIGTEKAKVLMAELRLEEQEVHKKVSKFKLVVGSSGITGLAIGRLQERPSHKDIEPLTWGRLFAVNVAVSKIAYHAKKQDV